MIEFKDIYLTDDLFLAKIKEHNIGYRSSMIDDYNDPVFVQAVIDAIDEEFVDYIRVHYYEVNNLKYFGGRIPVGVLKKVIRKTLPYAPHATPNSMVMLGDEVSTMHTSLYDVEIKQGSFKQKDHIYGIPLDAVAVSDHPFIIRPGAIVKVKIVERLDKMPKGKGATKKTKIKRIADNEAKLINDERRQKALGEKHGR